MVNHEETLSNTEVDSFHKSNNADADAIKASNAAMPQSPPPPAIAPTFPTGHTSRYDSDLDDVSVGLSSDDEDDDGRESSQDSTGWNSSMMNSSMMNSWISDGDEGAAGRGGPRFVPPLSVDDDDADTAAGEEAESVKAVSIRPSSTLYLTSLPTDALHRLSLFLTAQELASLGKTSKKMGGKCAEVWRRVRMHAARCLGEVMLAWSTGEHADARELAALYLQNGVPIYPAPHGHAYHTIAWRMGIEVTNMQDDETSSDTTGDPVENTGSTVLDPFYTSRFVPNEEERTMFNHHSRPYLTYVEEKSLFWKGKKGIPIEEANNAFSHPPSSSPTMRRRPSSARGRRRTTLDGVPHGTATAVRHALRRRDAGRHVDRPLRAMRRSSFASATPTFNAIAATSSPTVNTEKSDPKMTLRIHRHLADQHLFNLPSIQEENGNMHVGSMNLNADFFHPNIENSLRQRQQYVQLRRNHEWMGDETSMDETMRREATQENVLDGLLNANLPWDNRGLDDEVGNTDRMVDWDLAGDLGLMNPYRAAVRAVANSSSDSMHYHPPSSVLHASPASDVALQMYSLSSPNIRFDTHDNTNDTLTKVRVRFAHYQRKLELCLTSSSVQDFDDCLLDWWDEILPTSAGIHFYNRQSPVPRMSRLQSFLTTPCPKAIGVVQCEIERVKISSKKKLFPTYEYRLFIRDVKNDNPHNLPRIPPRKDSVLLVAKNKLRREKRSKNGHATAGPSPSESTSSKRGVTNYYMCLPQQRDVDLHYRSTNKSSELAPGEKSGLAVSPVAAASSTPVTVGRVQGNFIGTEFQIFSPAPTKVTKAEGRVSDLASSSDDGTDGDPPVVPAATRRRASVDTPNPRHIHLSGNGLVRMARRASLTMTRRPSISARRPSMSRFRRQSMDPAEGEEELKNKASRRLSWTGNLPGGAKKSNRTKRSAIANSESEGHSPTSICSSVDEEECGAITYTANLLGNRPRIMDVCVPKIMEDGSRSHAWRKVADTDADDGEVNSNNRMLTRFKAIQHEREQSDAEALDDSEGISHSDIDDHGLMILQNRPPWWNVEIGAFVLNFGGRVSVASVKNFQLCERTNQDQIMLQFGRIQGRHSFTMDLQYPLTPMQAFAIAISSLQSKISFG
eukprot:CCRYP_003413-RA/>CCRYP_003413-RA protein AED:0.01 eAED:0.01 QI:325/1/1/1/1/1/2/496/1130